MKKILVITLGVFIILGCSKQPSSEELKNIVERYSEAGSLNGSVLIANKNEILYKGAIGTADLENDIMNKESTRFALGSVTKQFTAVAILMLQEKGMLSIEDKISKYLELPSYTNDVSIKNLLNHTSGISDYINKNVYLQPDSVYSFLLNQNSLDFPVNTKHVYSNSGYFLLGEIIAKVSGMKYSDFMQENIFDPLQMKNTWVNQGTEFDRAIAYTDKWEKNDYLMSTADGGILSNIEDLHLWNVALTNNKLISEKSKLLMFTPLELENGKDENYGFGWVIGHEGMSAFDYITGMYKNKVSHTGWLASFGAYNQHDLKKGYYLIVLSNQIRPELMDLIVDLNRELYHYNYKFSKK